MSRIVPIISVLLLAPALVGCISHAGVDTAGGVDEDLTPPDILPYLDLSEDHDHANPDQHRASWNADVLGWTPFTEDGKAGRYNHVQVFGDYAYVGAYMVPPEMEPGVIVVDISEPAHPEVTGTWTSDFTTPIDIDISEDGQYALVGGHRDNRVPRPSQVPCTGIPGPGDTITLCEPYAPSGVELLDVSDPSNPTLVAQYTSAPSGAHTAKLHTIDGELYAFIASYGFHYGNRFASTVEILKVDSSVPGGFEPVGRYVPSEPSMGRTFVHDMTLQKHPKTDQVLMYVAYWNGGVPIVDVSDPSDPQELSQWKDFDAQVYGNIHYAKPYPKLVDGKHYTVAAPEFGSAEHAGETYFLDTTDPANPKLVSKFTIPGDPVSPHSYMHSPHNFDFREDGYMAFAHFHAGTWVLDLNPMFDGGAEPEVAGYVSAVPPEGEDLDLQDGALAPHVWHATWTDDGDLAISDIYSGLFVSSFTPPEEGESAPYEGLV